SRRRSPKCRSRSSKRPSGSSAAPATTSFATASGTSATSPTRNSTAPTTASSSATSQDLLETRFLSKGRRVDLIQLWHWFDDQMNGVEPMLIDGEEVFLNVHDKDLDKVRKRISEIQSFLPTLRSDDLEAFKRVKYKLRRTVMRLTYDLHHLFKRLEKYRKNFFTGTTAPPRAERLPL